MRCIDRCLCGLAVEGVDEVIKVAGGQVRMVTHNLVGYVVTSTAMLEHGLTAIHSPEAAPVMYATPFKANAMLINSLWRGHTGMDGGGPHVIACRESRPR
jgi:hypothetical protein